MKVYVFGNPDVSLDNKSFKIADKLKLEFEEIEFVEVKPNEGLPFSDKEDVVILDTVAGIERIQLLHTEDLDNIVLSNRTTVHDFDLGFQLKYLKKLGKLGEITIIGIPQEGEIDYSLIQSILRKLVAQDIQGS